MQASRALGERGQLKVALDGDARGAVSVQHDDQRHGRAGGVARGNAERGRDGCRRWARRRRTRPRRPRRRRHPSRKRRSRASCPRSRHVLVPPSAARVAPQEEAPCLRRETLAPLSPRKQAEKRRHQDRSLDDRARLNNLQLLNLQARPTSVALAAKTRLGLDRGAPRARLPGVQHPCRDMCGPPRGPQEPG